MRHQLTKPRGALQPPDCRVLSCQAPAGVVLGLKVRKAKTQTPRAARHDESLGPGAMDVVLEPKLLQALLRVWLISV